LYSVQVPTELILFLSAKCVEVLYSVSAQTLK
jgi:hypothetical protein